MNYCNTVPPTQRVQRNLFSPFDWCRLVRSGYRAVAPQGPDLGQRVFVCTSGGESLLLNVFSFFSEGESWKKKTRNT